MALDQSLRDVLREFSAAVSVPMDVSEGVRGQVRGRWPEMPAGEFIERLAKTEGLECYFDGAVLSVSAASESASRMLPLRGATLERVQKGLEQSGLLDQRFALRPGPAAGVVLVSGPPRFLAVVQQTIDAIADAVPPPAVPPAPLVQASAERRLQVFRGSAATSVVLR